MFSDEEHRANTWAWHEMCCNFSDHLTISLTKIWNKSSFRYGVEYMVIYTGNLRVVTGHKSETRTPPNLQKKSWQNRIGDIYQKNCQVYKIITRCDGSRFYQLFRVCKVIMVTKLTFQWSNIQNFQSFLSRHFWSRSWWCASNYVSFHGQVDYLMR